MRSPFPGMDPFLEDPAYWEDFHRSFITYLRDALLEQLPSNYDARIDQRVRLVDVAGENGGTRLPDIGVMHDPTTPTSEHSAMTATVLEPISIPMPAVSEERDVWLEIVRLPDRSLVTAIELLSPSNKTGEGAADYRLKRAEMYARHVNLVELDLLLGGERLHFGRALPKADYYASIARQSRRPWAEIYSWSLRGSLPTIPIPLRPPDGDVSLNLAEVFAIAYERGRYAGRLSYTRQMPSWIPAEHASWIREQTPF